MRRDGKLLALRGVLGHESFQRGPECVFYCPRHPHHRPKLSVNLDVDSFHCWVCGFKGKDLRPLLFLRGSTQAAVEYSDGVKERSVDRPTKTYEVPVLPPETRFLLDCPNSPYKRDALDYLKLRGLDEDEVIRYKLGFCVDGEYRYRIIIPSFDSSGLLNFFVGRKIYDHVGLSYKHGNFDKNIVFNDYLIDWDSPVTLVEGPFDAFAGGRNSIPLQGTIMREDSVLFAKIVTSGVPVYLALDSDAWGKQLTMAESLIAYGVEVHLVDVGSVGAKDVSELGRHVFQSLREAAGPIDPWTLLHERVRRC